MIAPQERASAHESGSTGSRFENRSYKVFSHLLKERAWARESVALQEALLQKPSRRSRAEARSYNCYSNPSIPAIKRPRRSSSLL